MWPRLCLTQVCSLVSASVTVPQLSPFLSRWCISRVLPLDLFSKSFIQDCLHCYASYKEYLALQTIHPKKTVANLPQERLLNQEAGDTLAHAHTSQVRCTVDKGYMRTQSSQCQLAYSSDDGTPWTHYRQTASHPCQVSAVDREPISRSLGKESLSPHTHPF